jgi:rhodanese-related sulfurtransferase
MIRSFLAFYFVVVGLLSAQIPAVHQTAISQTPAIAPIHPAVSPANPEPVSAIKPILDDKSYDFGMIPLGTEIQHTFAITNNTKAPLQIGKITISCDCTHLVAQPTVIAPGKTGLFQAVMNHHHTGYTDISINVPTGPAAKDLVTFHLIGVLVDKPVLSAPNPLIISASAVLQKKDVVLVDVRPPNMYAEGHAHNAQCIPPFAIVTRHDLKAHTVVLINDGTPDAGLLARIAEMKAQGFKEVYLLQDGYRAWKMAGGAIDGLIRAPAQVDLLTAADFYSDQKNGRGWLVINTDKTSPPIASAYPVKTIPLGTDIPGFTKSLLTELVLDKPQRVLLTSSWGNGYDQIEAALKNASLPVPLFYLQGGSLAYTAVIQQQTLALSSKTIALKNDQAYLASSRTTGRVVRGGGCASCGH